MGLTRQRKVFVGLLGLAGAALVIDQGFLAPRSASAGNAGPLGESAESLVVPRGTPTAGPGGALAAGLSPGVIAARLRAAAEGGDIGNAFALPPEWVAQAPVDTTRAPTPSPDGLTLSAVMPTSGGGIAVINGTPVRVGESVAGYRLLRVAGQAAVLERDGVLRRLELPIPTGGPRGM